MSHWKRYSIATSGHVLPSTTSLNILKFRELIFIPPNLNPFSEWRLRTSYVSWVKTQITLGRDPFNQNFLTFRVNPNGSATSLMDRFSPTGKVSKKSTSKGGPLFSVGLVWWKIDRSIWSFQPILNASTSLFSMCQTEQNTSHRSFCGLLTADLSVLLVHPCAATTGLLLLRKPSVCFSC